MKTPSRIASLPTDRAGRPIPWFVHIDEEGKEDFRIIGEGKIEEALTKEKCWVCGTRLTEKISYVVGPMCAVNLISAEPPSHRSCAVYSAIHCPFLNNPQKVRRDKGVEGTISPAGTMLKRNPGVALVWNTRRPIRILFDERGGILFDIGRPVSVAWYAEGRKATQAEVMESMGSGMPILHEEAEKDGPEAVAELNRLYEAALELVPSTRSEGESDE